MQIKNCCSTQSKIFATWPCDYTYPCCTDIYSGYGQEKTKSTKISRLEQTEISVNRLRNLKVARLWKG